MATITVQATTQFYDGVINTGLGGPKVGVFNSTPGSTITPHPMSLRYTITPSETCNKLTFSLAYGSAVESAAIVQGQVFRYGIGSSSSPPSSFNIFAWDTVAQTAENLELEYNFAQGGTYYLWLFYSYTQQNICYVDSVSVTSISGSTVVTPPETAQISISRASVFGGASNYWDTSFNKVATNEYFISTQYCSKNYIVGFQFTSNAPLSSLGMSIQWINNSASVYYRVNQDERPFTQPFLVSDTKMNGTGTTTTATINYAFAANTSYWVWIYTTSSSNSTNPTITFTPNAVTYPVTLPTGVGYIAVPAAGYTQLVPYGSDFKFIVSIDDGYAASSSFSVKANGVALTQSAGVYTISNVTAAQTVTVSGVVAAYPVTLTPGTGYTLSPYGGSYSPVQSGGSYQFTVTLDPEYIQGSTFAVKANDAVLTPNTSGVYTISNITAAQTVTVSGVMLGGICYIDNGTSFQSYLAYIDNGTQFVHYLPYVDTGTGWALLT